MIAAKKANVQIADMFALDPALPLWKYGDISERVHKTDATYVEVRITNAGLCGFNWPIGHATIYYHGGQVQPGCDDGEVIPFCAHNKVLEYFIENINHPQYVAQCDNFEKLTHGICTVIRDQVKIAGEPGNQR